MAIVKDFYNAVSQIAPFELAEVWDNCGLVVGDLSNEVTKCVLALDVTKDIIKEAEDIGANLIITHHPVIFDPIKTVTAPDLAYQLIQKGIALISAHTNYDKVCGGINDLLAQRVGLHNTSVMQPQTGFGRVGELDREYSVQKFAEHVKEQIGSKVVRYIDGRKPIKKVAVMSGGGAAELADAIASGADAYVTGDVKYDVALAALQAGITLIDAGHFDTENIVMDSLKERLNEQICDVEVVIAQSNVSPFDYAL